MSSLTHPQASTRLPLTMLMLLQDPQDMPPTLPPDVLPHPSLRFCTPAAPSRYASDTATQYMPRHCLTTSTLIHTYTSSPLPPTMLMFPQHPQDMPPTLPPNVRPHPSSPPLIFSAAYHAYAHVLY
ncbi:hypothetical protein O181_068838 [Austropuccinia psidii MF-1]|uniref:Uncharacterized protein n=1 Tax=Austropuccinia psidii MF-1 TaxID=1389203 RepID=A0A9Q3F147_9BASI|nr:hypothetical protein [Austropuccinia psidii MF-1]